jgi:hypothetical protein
MGVIDKLIDLGAQEGDTVYIDTFVFSFSDF